jgi:acetolactate synthase-1/2/3 large subunit
LAKPRQPLGRREFLKASLIAGSAGVAPGGAAAVEAPGSSASVSAPTAARAQAEHGVLDSAAPADAPQIVDPGSDFMVDLLRTVDIRYVAVMPGSTFRGLHESLVNYGGNRAPEIISCVHEEISAAMAHGYAKVAGRPMACLVHSNVGLQHASMALYNAWCDRVPLMVLVGNGLDASKRRPGVEWLHTMTDVGAMVRDFVKWDDVPVSLQHYAESFMRAYAIAATPPCGPVLLVVDSELQEAPIKDRSRLRAPKRSDVAPPGGDPAAVERAAALLAQARSPVIVVDRLARSARGVAGLVELAELLKAPVVDRGGRMNMPSNHFLNQTFRQNELIGAADLVLALELTDLWGTLNTVADTPERPSRRLIAEDCRVIAISAGYVYMKANVQDVERFYPADLAIAADGETCLPALIERTRLALGARPGDDLVRREAALRRAFSSMRAAAAADAARSWDASPIGTGRLCMEVWDQIKALDWALVSNTAFVSYWPQRLWDITEFHQFIGGEGGYGVGYGAPAAAGAALAHRDAGRIPVTFQTDGDLMVLPGTLWTLAHHRIPLLVIMHNNRAWHQEIMHLQRMANRRGRAADTASVGTVLEDPPIDYAGMARSMGVWSEGPIADPRKLKAALARALAEVRAGRPALLDVLTQPR